jgi:hypothetical protein
MRPLRQRREASSLIVGQPGVDALAADSKGTGHFADRVAVPDDS